MTGDDMDRRVIELLADLPDWHTLQRRQIARRVCGTDFYGASRVAAALGPAEEPSPGCGTGDAPVPDHGGGPRVARPGRRVERGCGVKQTNSARWEIIRAANKHKLTIRRVGPPVMFGMRHIQQAVCVARRNGLVSAETFELAGFRGRK